MQNVLVLGLETSGQPGTVAVVSERGVLAYRAYSQPNMHAEYLLDEVEAALASAGCAKGNLSRIAVGNGPGNFTGLRVGIALASGMGLGLKIEVAGVCSLASLAATIAAPDIDIRLITRDARREEAFCGVFTGQGEILTAPTLVKTNQLFDWLASRVTRYASEGKPTAVAGDGLRWLSNEQRAELGTYMPAGAESLTPDARMTALIGMRQHEVAAVAADYVRGADAKLPNIARNAVLDALAKR